MAKKRKKAKAKARRKSYVTNPAPKKRRRRRRASAPKARRRRSYRKNPDSLLDTGIFALSAVGGAVVANKVSAVLPGSNLIKNLAIFAGGVGLAYFGRRKSYLMGAGAGMAVMGGYNLITNQFPTLAGDNLTQEEQEEAIAALSGESDEYELLGTDEFNAPLSSPFAAPMFGAPLEGDMNSGAM